MKKIVISVLVLWLASNPVLSESPPPDRNPRVGLLECGLALVVVAAGAVICVKLCKLADKLNKPPGAPGNTNAAPSSYTGTAIPLQFGSEAVQTYDLHDIATNAAWNGPDGLPYDTMYTVHLETSDDLRQWTNRLNVTGYVSPTWVFCNANGTKTLTPRSATPVVTLPLSGERKFFRLRQ